MEKLLIANIARYHRGSMPKEKHLDFMALSEKDRKTAAELGAILRLADALDHGYENHIKNLKIRREGQFVVLDLAGSEDSRIEMLAVEKKKDLFEAAFGCQLKVVLNKAAMEKRSKTAV
jgi:exopolyphosphatase / guanosine-5'-triphosphate,3'-diphosphate pyrophosphatase